MERTRWLRSVEATRSCSRFLQVTPRHSCTLPISFSASTEREPEMSDNSQPTPSASKRLVTTKEAAERLHISPSFLAKARVTGRGPAYVKIGRAVRYSVEELEKFGLSRVQSALRLTSNSTNGLRTKGLSGISPNLQERNVTPLMHGPVEPRSPTPQDGCNLGNPQVSTSSRVYWRLYSLGFAMTRAAIQGRLASIDAYESVFGLQDAVRRMRLNVLGMNVETMEPRLTASLRTMRSPGGRRQ
jgi:hypothetical protein